MTKPHIPDVPEALRYAAEVFEQRDKQYGTAYRKVGEVLEAMFPEGITLHDRDEFLRFSLLNMMIGKILRYASAMERGEKQPDSLTDLAVYATMLHEEDEANFG